VDLTTFRAFTFHRCVRDYDAVVELAQGPRDAYKIIACDPSEVTCDMSVKVVWEDATDMISLPKFAPAGMPDQP